MIPLPNLSVLEFAGNDARQFLHNQLSSDVNALPVGSAGFSCCCNPAGRVIALMLLAPQAESIFAVCASPLAAPLQAWLARFVFRAKVTISLREDLLVCGYIEEAGKPEGILVKTQTGMDYVLLEKQTEKKENPEQSNNWKARELEAGICWLDQASSAQFLPQMLDYESIGALSFKKGCFPGQEIIARTRYLGKLKRRALKVRLKGGRNFGVMDKVDIHTSDESCSAVVVDCTSIDENAILLFLVVRASETIEPVSLSSDDQDFVLD